MCSTPRLGHYRLREEARATVGGRAMNAHAGKDLSGAAQYSFPPSKDPRPTTL